MATNKSPWNSDLWTSQGLNSGGANDKSRQYGVDVSKSYWDTYNQGVASRRNKRNQGFLDQARSAADQNNRFWDNTGKDLSIRNYDRRSWDDYKNNLQKNIDNVDKYGSLNNINSGARYNYQTDINDVYNIGRDFNSKFRSDLNGYHDAEQKKQRDQYGNTLEGNLVVRTPAQVLADLYGFDQEALTKAGLELNGDPFKKNNFGVTDPYELLKDKFMESYNNNFDAKGWQGVLDGNAGAGQFAHYLSRFGAQNSQDAEIMARLGMQAITYGDKLDGTLSFKSDNYKDLEGVENYQRDFDLIRSDAEDELTKLNQLYTDYDNEKTAAETYLSDLQTQLGEVNADTLAGYLGGIDNAYIEDMGGNEKFFNQFFKQYNSFNDFADNIRGNTDTLRDSLEGLGIRDIDDINSGLSEIEKMRNQITNYQSDLTGLDTESLNRLLDDLARTDSQSGYQDLLNKRTAEEGRIQSVKDMLGGRDEELGEMVDDAGIYNKEILDQLKGRFDDLDKYKSDYEGDDKFSSELDFDFSEEFSDIDNALSGLMDKYGERDSALAALLMDGDESLSDRLSGNAENDLSGFDDLRSLLSENANELAKFSGDDLDDEVESLTELLNKANEGRQNIFDQRSNLEQELTDLYDQVKTGNFYTLDDVQSGRDGLNPFTERQEYWDAEELTEDEFDKLNSFYDKQKSRIETDQANVANQRRIEKIRMEEALNRGGGELRFRNRALNELSDEQIAEIYQRSKRISDDPDDIASSIWDDLIVGGN